MRVAIMQPTWLPWMGYFDLIDQVDRFVFLDTVQFSRQSWHCRNRIKTSQGSKWISLPVSARFSDGTSLDTAVVHAERRIRKFAKTLRQEYSAAEAFETEFAALTEHLSSVTDGASLADINIDFIHFAMNRLGITTNTTRAGALPKFNGRVTRLVEICQLYGADTYVSVPGSADYIGLDGMKQFEAAGINLVFQRYDHPIYPQCGPGFLGFMSVVDLLLNAGAQAGAILRSGNRDPIPALEFFSLSRSESGGQENSYGAA